MLMLGIKIRASTTTSTYCIKPMKVYFELEGETPSDHWVDYEDEFKGSSKTKSPSTDVEAVICKKMYPSDYCFFALLPAARGERPDVNYHGNKSRYFVQIYNRDESVKELSKKTYEVAELCELISKLNGLTFSAAVRVWRLKGY